MKKLGMCVIALMLSQSALASGIPVLDGAGLAQSLTEYLEDINQGITQANQYSQQIQQWQKQVEQYKTQVQQYTQQMKDTAKPVTDTISTAKKLYDTGTSYYNYASSLGTQIASFNDYINNVVGNRETWENCALKQNCDLMGILQTAENKLTTLIDTALKKNIKTAEQLENAYSKVADQFNEDLQKCSGQNCAIEMNARATTELLRNQAKYNKAMLDYINNQTTKERQEQEKKLALKKKSQNSLTNSSKDITDGLGDVLSKELGW